ncbi:PucR family transcriptional regulator [Paenibacillus sp. 1001270B_150601_E10]|uniref:PucR family transcriptional regulator n=1 Tax=Paenibacillus sp. 1001270B_150601_E10 TaxID=2787079 RepID=UPI00189F3361|nr:helix-turn-helix domain-containing protein [Paenibacillus sp. 1001270B_150601_E10]
MNLGINPFDRQFDSIESIVDTISEVLQCPATIEDVSHKLIAYSSHMADTDQARIATIIGRRVPEYVINALWKEGIIQQIMSSTEAVRIPPIQELGLKSRIVIAIRNHQDVIGFIWVLDDHQLADDIAQLQLKRAAQAAKLKLLEMQNDRRKQEQQHFELCWSLLTGQEHSEMSIKEKALQYGIQLPDSYQVVVLEFDSEINEKQYQQMLFIVRTVENLRIPLYVIHQNRLIMIAGTKGIRQTIIQYEEERDVFVHRLIQRFATDAHVGCGSYYRYFTKAELSYHEALVVLQIKHSFPDEVDEIHNYKDLGYYRFLPSMYTEKEKTQVEHPSITLLRQYDLEHGSDLLTTLEVFLKHDSNVKKAAEALHVHTNTLTYRLKRMMEIGQMDLSQMDEKVTLYLELKLNKMK